MGKGRGDVDITPLHRVLTAYDWTQKPGYSNTKRVYAWGGAYPP